MRDSSSQAGHEIGFYFRISVDEALTRIVGGCHAINYYEAGMDRTHLDDTAESFRVFQRWVIDEYDRMVDEFGLVVIDASQSIEDQQAQNARGSSPPSADDGSHI